MSATWPQPGDVAMVTTPTSSGEQIAIRVREMGQGNAGGWRVAGAIIADSIVTSARPLLVIDPEDLAQVRRLLTAYWNNGSGGGASDGMQAALRSLLPGATPPRPAEPGQWGVVEASTESRPERTEWVHRGDLWINLYGAFCGYEHFVDPVVIRDGVTVQ